MTVGSAKFKNPEVILTAPLKSEDKAEIPVNVAGLEFPAIEMTEPETPVILLKS